MGFVFGSCYLFTSACLFGRVGQRLMISLVCSFVVALNVYYSRITWPLRFSCVGYWLMVDCEFVLTARRGFCWLLSMLMVSATATYATSSMQKANWENTEPTCRSPCLNTFLISIEVHLRAAGFLVLQHQSTFHLVFGAKR